MMKSRPLLASLERIYECIRAGNTTPYSKPGFAHSIKLSFNTMDKNALTWCESTKCLTYRYKFTDRPPSIGLFIALMDELSTFACFGAGRPASPPGLSLQMRAEFLLSTHQTKSLPFSMDISNTVTKLGRTISFTKTEFRIPSSTDVIVAQASHVKYMPTGNRIYDFLLSKWGYPLFQLYINHWIGTPPIYPEQKKDVLESNLRYDDKENDNVASSFDMTLDHVNPFGSMHGGCQAMVMELVGKQFMKKHYPQQEAIVDSMNIDFLSAFSSKKVHVECEIIGKGQNQVHLRVLLLKKKKNTQRVVSDGQLRFTLVS